MKSSWWLMSAFLVACATTDDSTDATDDTVETDDTDAGTTLTGDVDAILALTADTTAGAQLFADNCELCHTATGEGTGPYPNITGKGLREIVESVIAGPGAMASAEESQFVDQDVADVAAYAETL